MVLAAARVHFLRNKGPQNGPQILPSSHNSWDAPGGSSEAQNVIKPMVFSLAFKTMLKTNEKTIGFGRELLRVTESY